MSTSMDRPQFGPPRPPPADAPEEVHLHSTCSFRLADQDCDHTEFCYEIPGMEVGDHVIFSPTEPLPAEHQHNLCKIRVLRLTTKNIASTTPLELFVHLEVPKGGEGAKSSIVIDGASPKVRDLLTKRWKSLSAEFDRFPPYVVLGLPAPRYVRAKDWAWITVELRKAVEEARRCQDPVSAS